MGPVIAKHSEVQYLDKIFKKKFDGGENVQGCMKSEMWLTIDGCVGRLFDEINS